MQRGAEIGRNLRIQDYHLQILKAGKYLIQIECPAPVLPVKPAATVPLSQRHFVSLGLLFYLLQRKGMIRHFFYLLLCGLPALPPGVFNACSSFLNFACMFVRRFIIYLIAFKLLINLNLVFILRAHPE